MPWMLPKELEMFGLNKAYNKRLQHHAPDLHLDQELVKDRKRGEDIRKEVKDLVARQIASNVDERLKNSSDAVATNDE